VRAVDEASGDAERGATATADGPEEVGVLVLVRGDEGAIGEDEVDFEDVVGAWGESVNVKLIKIREEEAYRDRGAGR
jgi:hypothetical protein